MKNESQLLKFEIGFHRFDILRKVIPNRNKESSFKANILGVILIVFH